MADETPIIAELHRMHELVRRFPVSFPSFTFTIQDGFVQNQVLILAVVRYRGENIYASSDTARGACDELVKHLRTITWPLTTEEVGREIGMNNGGI